MRHDEIDAFGFVVSDRRQAVWVEEVANRRVGDVERIVDVDIPIGVVEKIIEDV